MEGQSNIWISMNIQKKSMSNTLPCPVDGKENASVYISHILVKDLLCMWSLLLEHRTSCLLSFSTWQSPEVFACPVTCVNSLTGAGDVSKADDHWLCVDAEQLTGNTGL